MVGTGCEWGEGDTDSWGKREDGQDEKNGVEDGNIVIFNLIFFPNERKYEIILSQGRKSANSVRKMCDDN